MLEAKIAEVHLDDRDDVANVLAITSVTPSGGDPDIVIGDVAAGIPDPIPAPCVRVDAQVIRCPADDFGLHLMIMPMLQGGDDELTITLDVNPVLGDGTRVTANLGRGADSARDFSEFRDFFYGEPGNDRMMLGPNRDKAWGGPGADRALGGPGRDFLWGQAQNDFLHGGGNADIIDCGKGPHDIGVGGPGRDLGRNCEVVRH
jgi:Ca2+-binding RTX toxin-like protein